MNNTNLKNQKIWERIFEVAGVAQSKMPEGSTVSATLLLELKKGLIKRWGGSRIIALKPHELNKEEQEAQAYYKVITETLRKEVSGFATPDKMMDFFEKYDADGWGSLIVNFIKKHFIVILSILAILAFSKYLLT